MALLPSVRLKHKGLWAVVGGLVLLLGAPAVWGNRGLLHLWRLQSEQRELESTAMRLQQRNDDLRGHLRRLRSDRSYQERVVRERLGWVKDGELLYRVPRLGGRHRSP